MHRLTKAQITSAKNGQNYTRTYSYGPTGNILNKSDVGSYDYLGWHPQAVTKAGAKSYTYDDNGSLTGDDTWAHTYDTRGRLTKSEKKEVEKNIMLLHMDDEKGATSFADSAGSKGSVPCIGQKCSVWTASKSTGDYEFDGKNDYLVVPDNANLGFTSEYTLSAWVNPNTIPIYAPVFVRGTSTGDDIEVYIRKDGLMLVHNRTNGGKFSYTLNDNLPDNPPSNKWSHFVITWKDNKWKVYIDGVLKYTSITKENPKNTGKWYIGKTFHKAFGTNNVFDGKMDEIAFFDRALTNTEISDMYKGGTKIITYSYDEGNERVMKNKDGEKTYYVNNLYEEDSKEIRKFVYANDVKVASLTKSAGSSVEKQAFHHADHLGSSNVTTDETGKVMELAAYYPYGDIQVEEKDTGYNNDYLYTGKELDRDTGLYYYGARYYDPLIGRFTGVDPWGGDINDPQSLNKYSYVRNNPMKYVDENGEWFETFWDVGNTIVDYGSIIKNEIEIFVDTVKYVTTDDKAVKENAVANISKNTKELESALVDITADAIATAVPFLPAGTTKVKKINDAVDNVKDSKKNELPRPKGTGYQLTSVVI